MFPRFVAESLVYIPLVLTFRFGFWGARRFFIGDTRVLFDQSKFSTSKAAKITSMSINVRVNVPLCKGERIRIPFLFGPEITLLAFSLMSEMTTETVCVCVCRVIAQINKREKL